MYFAHCFPWNKGVMHLHRIWLLALPSVQAVLPLSMATPNASIWSFRSAVTFSLCCDYVELWRLPTARTDFLWPICFGELHEQSEQHLCCPRHWLPIWLLSTIRGVDSDFQSAAQPAFYLAGPFSLPCFTPATEKLPCLFGFHDRGMGTTVGPPHLDVTAAEPFLFSEDLKQVIPNHF